jgi:thymidylate kinase
MIKGILIEGTDFIGKTVVAQHLVRRLSDESVDVYHSQCFLEECSLIQFLLKEAKRHETLKERDYFYTSACLLDLNLPRRERGFRIQERHWLTQVGRNKFFYDTEFDTYTTEIARKHLLFSCQVYLTSDVTAKRRRSSSRPAKSPRDRLLANDPAVHQKYDDFVIGLLPPDEDWHVIDTSGLSIAEVGETILRFEAETVGGSLSHRVAG